MIINDNNFNKLNDFSDKLLKKEIYSSRYVKPFFCCPHCKSIHFIKFGKYNDIQRYRCKDCRKTFSNTTNSVWKYCKKPCRKWVQYTEYLMHGETLKFCAEKLEISIATAFYWRHKLLHGVDKNTPENFKDIVFIGRSYVGISNKGSKGKAYQYKNKFYKRYDLFRTNVIVSILYDTNDSMSIKVLGQDDSLNRYENKIFAKIDKMAYIKSINNKYLKDYIIKHNKKLPLKLRKSLQYDPNSYYLKDNIICSKEILNCSLNLNKWLSKFKGVASKYLNHYCSLFSLGFIKKEYDYMTLFFETLCNNVQENYYLRIRELKTTHELEFTL